MTVIENIAPITDPIESAIMSPILMFLGTAYSYDFQLIRIHKVDSLICLHVDF